MVELNEKAGEESGQINRGFKSCLFIFKTFSRFTFNNHLRDSSQGPGILVQLAQFPVEVGF